MNVSGGILRSDRSAEITAQVARLLRQDSVDRESFRTRVAEAAAALGDSVYSALLHTAVHLEFGERVARKHFGEVMQYWDNLCSSTGREIDFRVALLDYYLTVNKRIKNPKIIEIKVFEKTRQETEIDELTQLYNYRYFRKTLQHEVTRASRYRAPLSMVVFDVDDFKHYNDSNGHMAGNKALKKLAGIIHKSVREVDVVARFGGEEFVLLLPETNKEGAFTIADRIRKAVARAAFVNSRAQPLKCFSISGGVAALHSDATDSAMLIKRADQALYMAKGRGKNQIAFYREELREFERVYTDIRGEIRLEAESAEQIQFQDLSEGGMRFRHAKALPVATLFQLRFLLPGQDESLACKARVRRVEALEPGGQYSVGASIVRMAPRQRKVLKAFVRELADLNIAR